MTGKYERVVLERRVLDRPLADGHRRRHARGVRRRRVPTSILSRALRDGDSDAARPQRAGARAAESPRVRDGRLLPPVRRHARLPELQRVARRARRGRRPPRALPLLQLLGARAERVSALRRPVSRAGRLRHRARRGRGEGDVCPARASRGSTATRSAARARSTALLSRFRDGEHRRARRHADDREGARLSARDAGRRRSRPTSASASPTSARRSGRFSC